MNLSLQLQRSGTVLIIHHLQMLSNGLRTTSVSGAGPPSLPTSRTELLTPRPGVGRTCPLQARPVMLRRLSRTFASSSTSTSVVMLLANSSVWIPSAVPRAPLATHMSPTTPVISMTSTGRSSTSTSTSSRRPSLPPLRLPSLRAPPPPSSARLRPAPPPRRALPSPPASSLSSPALLLPPPR